MSSEKPNLREDLRRVAKYAAIAGVVLGVACPTLPAKYQAPCQTVRAVIQTCTGVSP